MLKFVKTATIIKTHGYKGDIVLKKEKSISSNLFEECLEEGDAIFVEKDGIPVPFFITKDSLYFFGDDTARLRFDDVENVEKAQNFIGEDIFFTEDCLETENPENLSPLHWTGFKVIDEKHGFIGTLVDFNDETPQNPLLIIEKEEQELLIPYNENFIVEISLDKKEITTLLPDGFLDLYS